MKQVPKKSKKRKAGVTGTGGKRSSSQSFDSSSPSFTDVHREHSVNPDATERDITARRLEEKNLRRFATVVRDSNDAITIQDFEGRITAWNRGAELMYGYSEEEALLANIELLTAPEKVAEQQDFIRRLVEGEAITSFETRRVTKDGRVLDVWMTVTKLTDDAGKPIGLASTERDITARRQEEKNLRRFATVVLDSNDAITIQDFEGRITAWNRGAELMYGYSEEEALLANIELLTAPEKVAEQQDFIRRLVEGEAITSFETRRVTKDGRVLDVWMTVTKLTDDAGKPIGLASTERDITARRQEEKNLRRFATVVRDSNDAITIQDFEGRITAWNRGAELMYGYSEEEALLANIELLTTPDKVAEQQDFIRRLVEGEAITSFETQRVTKDGRVLDVWMTVTKLIDDAGKPIGLASTERDITERKRAEDELKKHHKHLEKMVEERTAEITRINERLQDEIKVRESVNKELEAFSYSISHDLRAPLRAIDGFTKILEDEYKKQFDDEGIRLLTVIRKNTRNMGQLIDDLLTFSRLGRQEIQYAHISMEGLARAVSDELRAASAERDIRFTVKELPTSYGDMPMIRQVFFNLIANAVKFTRNREPAVIEIGFTKEENQHVYYVKDNGVGFDMQYADKLFGVFQRLHSVNEFEGTGVGLALTKSIILKHGGSVRAEGKVNEGATFFFSLPIKGDSN